jgi:pilus assembly protein CpaB
VNRRKLLGVIGAIVMAGIGTGLLIAYVNNAEDRALEGEEIVEVFTVVGRIDPGTPAADIESDVTIEQVPQKVRADDAVGDLTEIEGLVAEIELRPGEQLLKSRFIDPIAFQREAGRVTDIPPGLQEVTVRLSPARAAGGRLLPGDTVGVFASFGPFQISSEVPVELDDGTIIPPDGSTPNTTHLFLHKVLVTNVQLGELPEVEEREGLGDEEDQEVRLAPSDSILVTLAVDTFAAEQLVFTAEFGSVWLSLEPGNAVEEPSIIQNRGTVYFDREELFLGIEIPSLGDGGDADDNTEEDDG